MDSKASYTPEQADALDKISRHLDSKPATVEQIQKFLEAKLFPKEMIPAALADLKAKYPNQVLSAPAPKETAAETSSTELIKTYINKIYQRFLVDPLFLYELEAVSKNKSGSDLRILTFLDQIPYFFELDQPSHAALLIHPKVRAVYTEQVNRLFLEPIKKVFLAPGKISLKKFVLMTGLKGQAFVDLTTQLENDSYANVDIKRDEMQFQVAKIAASRAQFRQYLALFKGSLPEGEKSIDKILLAFESTVQVPENQPAYQAFKRIQTKTIPFNHLDLKLLKDGAPITAEKMTTAYYEALLLLNFFKRTDLAKGGPSNDIYIQYSDKLTMAVKAFAEKATLAGFAAKQVTMCFACLSMLQGKSLMLINEYFKTRNALEYDAFASTLKKAY